MRITTQMLNESARKAGIPLHQGSLLDYINKNDNATNPLMQTSQAKTTGKINRSKFEKQEKSADELFRQIQKFTGMGEKNLLDKCRESGDKTELCKEAENLVEKYNTLLTALNSNPDTLDLYYRQSMKDLISSNKDLLAEAGIVAGKDGKLKVDTEKLKNASEEKLQEIFGGKSEFMAKLQFLSEKVSDHATANIQSATSNYSQNGNMNFYSPNRYDLWG